MDQFPGVGALEYRVGNGLFCEDGVDFVERGFLEKMQGCGMGGYIPQFPGKFRREEGLDIVFSEQVMPEGAQAVVEDEFQKWFFLGAGEAVFDCAQGLGGVVGKERQEGQSMVLIVAFEVRGLRFKVIRIGISFTV